MRFVITLNDMSVTNNEEERKSRKNLERKKCERFVILQDNILWVVQGVYIGTIQWIITKLPLTTFNQLDEYKYDKCMYIAITPPSNEAGNITAEFGVMHRETMKHCASETSSSWRNSWRRNGNYRRWSLSTRPQIKSMTMLDKIGPCNPLVNTLATCSSFGMY